MKKFINKPLPKPSYLKIDPVLFKDEEINKNNLDPLMNEIITNKGDIFGIQKCLLMNNIRLDMVDEENNDESIVHKLIKLDILSNHVKLNILKFLVLKGAPIDRTDRFKITPLLLASKQHNYDLVEFLFSHGANPMSYDQNNQNALHYALKLDTKRISCFKPKKIIKKPFTAENIKLIREIVKLLKKNPTLLKIKDKIFESGPDIKKYISNIQELKISDYRIITNSYGLKTIEILEGESTSVLSGSSAGTSASTTVDLKNITLFKNNALKELIDGMTLKLNVPDDKIHFILKIADKLIISYFKQLSVSNRTDKYIFFPTDIKIEDRINIDTLSYDKYIIDLMQKNIKQELDNDEIYQPSLDPNSVMTFNIESLDVCYKLNINLISLLITNGVNINQKDNLSNTPIFYVIDLQNKNLLDIFIQNGASFNDSSAINLTGLNPFQYAVKNLLNTFEFIDIKKKLKEQYEESMKTFLEEIEIDVNFRFPSIIFHMLIYLFQQYISSQNTNFEEYSFPIQITNDSVLSGIIKMNINNEYKYYTEKIDDLTNQIKNIEQEYSKNNNTDLKNECERLKNELDSVNKQMESLKTSLKIFEGKNNAYTLSFINKIKQLKKFNNYQTIPDIYDTVFENISTDKEQYSSDRIAFGKLWKYKLTNEFDDETQIMTNTCNKLKTIFENSTTKFPKNIGEISDVDKSYTYKSLDLLENVYYKFYNDYVNLPQKVYEREINYALYDMINIIAYIVKNTIMLDYFSVVMKALIEHIKIQKSKDVYDGEDYDKYINNILDNILEEYNIKISEKSVIKIIGLVFEIEQSNDIDASIKMELNNNLKPLLNNTHIKILPDSIFYDKKNEIIKIFIAYLKIFITDMKSLLEYYIKSYVNIYKNLDIIVLLMKKI